MCMRGCEHVNMCEMQGANTRMQKYLLIATGGGAILVILNIIRVNLLSK